LLKLQPCNTTVFRALKDKVNKTNAPTLVKLRNIYAICSRTPGTSARELTKTCSAGILISFGKEGIILSICCTTGESFFGFLKVTVTMILCVGTFTDSYSSQHTAYDATLEERRAVISLDQAGYDERCMTNYLLFT
jgi:hypothetical protein